MTSMENDLTKLAGGTPASAGNGLSSSGGPLDQTTLTVDDEGQTVAFGSSDTGHPEASTSTGSPPAGTARSSAASPSWSWP
jgi:hypothetical protein